jgi:hypothetical protein
VATACIVLRCRPRFRRGSRLAGRTSIRRTTIAHKSRLARASPPCRAIRSSSRPSAPVCPFYGRYALQRGAMQCAVRLTGPIGFNAMIQCAEDNLQMLGQCAYASYHVAHNATVSQRARGIQRTRVISTFAQHAAYTEHALHTCRNPRAAYIARAARIALVSLACEGEAPKLHGPAHRRRLDLARTA